jgi:hypothetical protein
MEEAVMEVTASGFQDPTASASLQRTWPHSLEYIIA